MKNSNSWIIEFNLGQVHLQQDYLPNKKAKIIYFRQLVSISLILCVLIYLWVCLCAPTKKGMKNLLSQFVCST